MLSPSGVQVSTRKGEVGSCATSDSASVRETRLSFRAKPNREFHYGASFDHTITRGLVAAPLGQVTVLSLTRVTALLRGPQYATIRTSSSLHSPLHVAASQLERTTRSALSPLAVAAAPGGPGGPSAP